MLLDIAIQGKHVDVSKDILSGHHLILLKIISNFNNWQPHGKGSSAHGGLLQVLVV